MRSSRGNAFPLVIIAIIVSIVVLLSIQATPVPTLGPQAFSAEKISAEMKMSASKAVKGAQSQIMMNGFSAQSPVWFSNSPSVPTLEELDSNFSALANSTLRSMLSDIAAKEGLRFDVNSITVIMPRGNGIPDAFGEIMSIQDDASPSVSSEIIAGIIERDGNKQVAIAQNEELWPGMLFMYKKMVEWSGESLPALSTDAGKVLDDLGPCQIAKCGCTGALAAPLITDQEIDSLLPIAGARDGFEALMAKKVDGLSSKFKGSGIICTYELKEFETDRKVTRKQSCISPSESGKYHCGNLTEGAVAYAADLRQRNPDNSYAQWPEFSEKNTLPIRKSAVHALAPLPWPAGAENSILLPCAAPQFKEEEISANPQLYAKAIVKCENPSILVGAASRAQPLSAQIVLIFAIQKDCRTDSVLGEAQPNRAACTP